MYVWVELKANKQNT